MNTELDKIIAVITDPRNRLRHMGAVRAYMNQAIKKHPLSRTTLLLAYEVSDREVMRRETKLFRA